MSKYIQLAKATFQEYLVYRLSFLLWRLRNLLFLLSLYFFWQAILGSKGQIFGYGKTQMFTYVIGIAFLRSFVFASRSFDFGNQIKSGEINKLIVSPINVFGYWFTRDVVDKLLNIFFSILEVALIIFLVKIPFFVPANMTLIFLSILMALLAVLSYFFYSLILSVMAFWTEEIWATRWLFGVILLEFFSGAIFPLDILPKFLQKIIFITPFPYLLFYPLKIWLGSLSLSEALRALFISSLWLIFFWFLSAYLWQRGLRKYGAYGD